MKIKSIEAFAIDLKPNIKPNLEYLSQKTPMTLEEW